MLSVLTPKVYANDKDIGESHINAGICKEPANPSLFNLPKEYSKLETIYTGERIRSSRFPEVSPRGYPDLAIQQGNKMGPNGVINPLSYVVPRSGIIPTLRERFNPNYVIENEREIPIDFYKMNRDLPSGVESQAQRYENAIQQQTDEYSEGRQRIVTTKSSKDDFAPGVTSTTQGIPPAGPSSPPVASPPPPYTFHTPPNPTINIPAQEVHSFLGTAGGTLGDTISRIFGFG